MKKYIVRYSVITEKEVPTREEAESAADYLARNENHENVRVIEFNEGEITIVKA